MAKILLCDDEPTIGKLFEEWLELTEHSATVLTKPELVLPAILKDPFDLVIIDYKMPNMTGKEVLSEIRSLFSPAELPVAFLTGHGEKDLVIEVAKLGISGFFVKPLNFDAMGTKIPMMLTKRLDIQKVRALMEKCNVPDRTLSQQPGLSAYLGRPSALFSVSGDDGKYIIAAGEKISSLRAHQQWKDSELALGVKVYVQLQNKWSRIWPTMWDKN